ncbi:hypothetical protein [Bradyrhizobium sp. McL0616]|uniref:hypothetical protein n=1 Tax=Bradyrhizobium sp. McL0616 TaxID=3415674 RepID=UPI003CEDDE8E
MIDQPAVEAPQQRSLIIADHAQQRPAERREHERSRRQRVDGEHEQLAVGKSNAIHDTLRQQQQRRIGFLELDRMLVGDPSCDRKQPAREQVWIEDDRDQDRKRKAKARRDNQDEFPPARQRQEIERGQHRAEHQLERHHKAEQCGPCDTRGVCSIIVRRRRDGTQQERKCGGRQEAAQDCKIARGQHPFESNERAEHAEHPEPDVAQTAWPAETGQKQTAEQGEDEKDASVMTDEKATRAQRTEHIQRRRQIGIGELGALQILDEVGIEPIGMCIDRRAIDANIPAVIHIERGIVGEIAEHQKRHQRDQAGEPNVTPRRHPGRRTQPLCCTGDV